MGLTLFWELRLPPRTPRADVVQMLGQLHAAAVKLPFERVWPLVDLETPEDRSDEDRHIGRLSVEFYATLVGDPMPPEEGPRYTGSASSAVGFRVGPGEGPETATFALMRRRAESTLAEEWYWWCACKTQYASNVSDEHFMNVHMSLIALLDAAVQIGFEVTVVDEGNYWESRSTEQLAEEVTKMNRLMARFGGALSDALGDGHSLQAPIFEHRRFERLEMGE